MEVAELRRRVRGAVERARQEAAERRVRRDTALRDYEDFLTRAAVPAFRQFAVALAAEGHAFSVQTPAGSVRLTSDHATESFVEVTLDDTADTAVVIGRTTTGRGRRMVTSERPLAQSRAIVDLGEEDVVNFLVEEIVTLFNVKS